MPNLLSQRRNRNIKINFDIEVMKAWCILKVKTIFIQRKYCLSKEINELKDQWQSFNYFSVIVIFW